MSNIRIYAAAVTLGWVLLVSIAGAQTDRERLMILTFDDLPYAAGGYSDTLLRARIFTDELIRTLAMR